MATGGLVGSSPGHALRWDYGAAHLASPQTCLGDENTTALVGA
jgi:hypothetical protein